MFKCDTVCDIYIYNIYIVFSILKCFFYHTRKIQILCLDYFSKSEISILYELLKCFWSYYYFFAFLCFIPSVDFREIVISWLQSTFKLEYYFFFISLLTYRYSRFWLKNNMSFLQRILNYYTSTMLCNVLTCINMTILIIMSYSIIKIKY